MKSAVFFCLFILVGFFLRVLLANLAYSTPVYDMSGYYTRGQMFLDGILLSDCCEKNNGYPVFVGMAGYFFGIDNLGMFRVVQIVVDLGSAILIYLIARNYFSRNVSIISFSFYILNPFTSAFTGLRLPEVLSGFFLLLTGYIISRLDFSKRGKLWVFFGFFLGILVFVRMSYFYFAIVVTFISGSILFRQFSKKILFIITVCIWFIIASFYTLISNYSYFRKISFVAPYNRLFGHLYGNFYYKEYPELFVEFNNEHIDPRYTEILLDYARVTPDYREFGIKSAEGINEINEKYKKLFIAKMKKDWPIFLENTASNIFWLWEKEHLYVYVDPFYPGDNKVVGGINIFSISIFILGLGIYIKKLGKKIFGQSFFIYTIFLFSYTTFFFGLISNESRHTIPLYGFLYLWGGYGIDQIIQVLNKNFQHV